MGYFFYQEPVNYINSINADNFDDLALQVFRYQYKQNAVYAAYVNALNINPEGIKSIVDIPFLPISFFKTHEVVSGAVNANTRVFRSSTTTGNVPSQHFIIDEQLYDHSLMHGFTQFYGDVKDYVVLALLPSYLERDDASLVYMAKQLIDASGREESGFYLNEFDLLFEKLQHFETIGQPVLLLGVTFALLDFAEQHQLQLKHTIVMETGGMKGRRKEMIREDVHHVLNAGLGVGKVHSEYGMTELLSQAYSKGDGVFKPMNSMKVLLRNINDPFEIEAVGSGCLNIIDLANVNSCSFIATDDIGRIHPDKSFEVLGRVDSSALRGCNLMVI